MKDLGRNSYFMFLFFPPAFQEQVGISKTAPHFLLSLSLCMVVEISPI